MKLKNQDKENTDEFTLLLLGKMIMMVIPRKKHHKVYVRTLAYQKNKL